MSNRLVENFGIDVFNEAVMQQRLPQPVFAALMQTRKLGEPLDVAIAQQVADAMLQWALEKGATHYTHWFQPLTGVTAEKHDSFLQPDANYKPITVFSSKALVRGESDASSFPSGSLRATFEARGYTTWDPTSDAFVKNNSLYIPTAFCSYSGEALDEKTPLLRSMGALNLAARRVLSLLGQPAGYVSATVGPEQEYFLIDRELYQKRPDLVITGRTLFGVRPPKGQELTEHYFGHIKPRVWAFMADVDQALWRLGVYATTKHNEGAPCQHELAVIFSVCNLAVDHNHLVMEVLQSTAEKYDMVCLLREKPFAHVNGSGKHNNWSLCCDDGRNLLSPGSHPQDNWVFLLFLSAVIRAVDNYADLLRITAADAGNDHRLGGNEAPPAILSIYLGEHLHAILESVAAGQPTADAIRKVLATRVDTLPQLYADFSDRNRTSPLAFTGNKFEFRMPGASASPSFTNTVFNSIVADALNHLAGWLAEDPQAASSDPTALSALPQQRLHDRATAYLNLVLQQNGRVLFNGDNYAPQWRQEAEKRGLPCLPTTADALPHLLDDKNIALFDRLGVLTRAELTARHDILVHGYNRTLRMECYTLLDMANKDLLPAAQADLQRLCRLKTEKTAAGLAISASEQQALQAADNRLQQLQAGIDGLTGALAARPHGDQTVVARYGVDTIVPAMQALVAAIDNLEAAMPATLWPYPTYTQLLLG